MFFQIKTFRHLGLALAAILVSACSNPSAPEVARSFGSPIAENVERASFHSRDTGIGACSRLEQLRNESVGVTNLANGYSFLQSFDFELDATGPKNFRAGVRLLDSPLQRSAIASPRIRALLSASDSDFLEMMKVSLKLVSCPIDEAAQWGTSCRLVWRDTMGPTGCVLPGALSEANCQAIWSQVMASAGACSGAITNPPLDLGAACSEAARSWAGLNALAQAEALYRAKNALLSERFPGIFGEVGDAAKSLPLGILAKIRGFFLAGPGAVSGILTTKTTLFPASGSWADWRRDVEISGAAWVNGASTEGNVSERLCSMTLSQRSFAQILSLSGYLSPELTAEGNIAPLGPTHLNLAWQPVMGAFLESNAGSFVPTVLSPEVLASYDPSARLLVGASLTPNADSPATQPGPETLSDRLERMLGVELFFEATSPAAVWQPLNAPYLVGDLENRANSAILPAEAHALSFALLGLDFKNLAFLNLRFVNRNGAIVDPAREAPAGIVLLQSMSADFKGVMTIRDLSRLTTLIVRLDAALSNILEIDPATLSQRSSFYDSRIRASAGELRAKLRGLKLPMALLLSRMAEADLGGGRVACVASAALDLAPEAIGPRLRPTGICSPEIAGEVKAARALLSASLLGPR